MPRGFASAKRTWHGDQIAARGLRATGRGSIAIAEHVAVAGKRNAHVISGDMRRSIHTAPEGYLGEDDEALAATGDVTVDYGADDVLDGSVATVETGSWLAYACAEEVGRGHKFMEPAVEEVRGNSHGIMASAFKEEGL